MQKRARGITKDGRLYVTEKVFQGQIRKAALLNGWKYYHTWNSFRSTEGFPDCVLVHEKKARLIFAELKTDTGKVSQAQEDWLKALRAVQVFCIEVYLWRPSDFDEIWEILRK